MQSFSKDFIFHSLSCQMCYQRTAALTSTSSPMLPQFKTCSHKYLFAPNVCFKHTHCSSNFTFVALKRRNLAPSELKLQWHDQFLFLKWQVIAAEKKRKKRKDLRFWHHRLMLLQLQKHEAILSLKSSLCCCETALCLWSCKGKVVTSNEKLLLQR